MMLWFTEGMLVAVGSVKPAIATLDLHVISVPKAKKKPKKEKKEKKKKEEKHAPAAQPVTPRLA